MRTDLLALTLAAANGWEATQLLTDARVASHVIAVSGTRIGVLWSAGPSSSFADQSLAAGLFE